VPLWHSLLFVFQSKLESAQNDSIFPIQVRVDLGLIGNWCLFSIVSISTLCEYLTPLLPEYFLLHGDIVLDGTADFATQIIS
jgi:hypothetical protein